MSDSESEKKTARLEPELRDMKIEEGSPVRDRGDDADSPQVKVEGARPAHNLTPIAIPRNFKSRSATHSPVKKGSPSSSASEDDALEETLGGDITLKMEPGKAPRLARTASQKVISRPPPLFLDLPDSTEEAKMTFKVLPECTYGNKTLGTTEHALECDCTEEWDPVEKRNFACGEDSDCINRATKMECVGDCSCGAACQNQRFQRKQYADVTVIKTDKKGHGLRANKDMKPGDFVFEYIGEVINEANFRRRMIQYDEEGIKHFYFMSLTKGEFVDATKKGNLGRFCNHSCNPNCYVDKWVVGDKLRMGIFAERRIKAGEELVFNYNVDRYGADPQPCYCDEPNCTGFIGGKTQTDRATKLSHATIEALGIDDGDGWESAVAKKPRKKKASEDDEEYINDLQPKSLEEHGVTKVMGALNQCKEKWIAVKLLSRIQRSDDEGVGNRVLRMHGYNILAKTINAWKDDFNVVLQVLDILHKLPRMTRNKIHDSGIESTITDLTTCGDERVESEASRLLEAWSKLTMGYRIPRVKRDPNASTPVRIESHFERREKARERSRSRSKSPAIDAPKGPSAVPKGPAAAPSGPRFNPQKSFLNGPRPPPRPRAFHPLPPGWSEARHPDSGALYYYNGTGHTQWQRPTLPAQQPPPPPPKAKSDAQKLQDIISSITKNATPTRPSSATGTPQQSTEELKPEKKSKSDKWKDVPQEKKEKYYENVLAPHIKEVVFSSKYRDRFEKDDLKRLAKEVGKKLVRGDFKANRVDDPRKPLSEKHKATVKKYIKSFMEKAVEKKAARDQVKSEKKTKEKAAGPTNSKDETPETPLADVKNDNDDSDDDMLAASDDECGRNTSPADSTTTELKRKREEESEQGSPKKSRTQAPPPPPPPPPAEDRPSHLDDSGLTPMEEVSDAFLPEALESGNGAPVSGKSALPNDVADNFPSPMQLATPPTTTNGSCEHDSTGHDGSNGGGSVSVMANGGS